MPEKLDENSVSGWKAWLDGSIGSIAGKSITSPLDRLKILIQTRKPGFQDVGVFRKNNGLSQALIKIYKTEGIIRGIYRSNSIAWARHAIHGGTGFYIHDKLQINKYFKDVYGRNYIIGSLSGIGATFISFPLDTFRVQVATKQGRVIDIWRALAIHNNQNLKSANVNIIKNLYSGLLSSQVGVALYAGLNFGIRDELHDLIKSNKELNDYCYNNTTLTKVSTSFSLGWISGCITQCITYPIEVVKRRRQVDSSSSYKDIVKGILKPKGWFSVLYRGFSLNIIRHPICNGVVWLVRDSLQELNYL